MKLPRSAIEAESLAKHLREWYISANTQTGRAVVPLQLVNASLCHEVLDRLAPTLERHRGCVLIDLNPGVGVWSRCLHEFLKPRRHILVEPRMKLFAEHLKPLLDAPDSRYQWTEEPLANVFEHDMGDFGPVLSDTERHVTENPQILLTACFSEGFKMTKSALKTPEPMDYMNNVINSLYGLRGDLFRHGLFRSLIWMPDTQKYAVLPRTVDRQNKQSLQFAVTSTLTEVAGSQFSEELEFQRGRSYALIVEDMQAMHSKQRESGIIVPPGRQHELPTPPWEFLHPSVKTWKKEKHIDPPVFLPDLLALDTMVKQQRPEMYELFRPHWEDRTRAKTPRLYGSKKADPLLSEYFTLYARARRLHNNMIQKLRDADERRVNDQALRAAEANNDTDTLANLSLRSRELHKQLESFPSYRGLWIRKAVDDYRAYDTAALLWYRRPYDPLAVNGLDFASGWKTETTKTLALLDVNVSPDFCKMFNTYAATRSQELIMTYMINSRLANIRTALETIVPGAVDEFIKTIPLLQGAARDGRLDDLRVRVITPELWRDIAFAFYKWPFRPDDHDLWRALAVSDAIQARFRNR